MRRLLTSIFLLLFVAQMTRAQSAMILDHVDGTVGLDSIGTDSSIVFYLRLRNNSGGFITGYTNGFQIYSPDGATWSPITYDSTGAIDAAWLDGGMFFNPFSVTGSGADTVGFGGFRLTGTGIPNSFDQVSFMISTQVDSLQDGKTLCVDTCFYPPSGWWKWSTTAGDVFPEWTGPFCYPLSHRVAVGIADDEERQVPNSTALSQNYPNPFNSSTVIDFELEKSGQYKILIYNNLGRLVKEFADYGVAGRNSVTWDASEQATGVYMYRLISGSQAISRKMILLK